MTQGRLRRKLEALAGEEDMEFSIPHPLLPPRFQKSSAGRNMLLRVNSELQTFIGWEGARLHPWLTLTPRQACWLLRDVTRRTVAYRRDTEELGKFLRKFGSPPPPDPILADPSDRLVPEKAATTPPQDETPIKIELAGTGGESPLPNVEY